MAILRKGFDVPFTFPGDFGDEDCSFVAHVMVDEAQARRFINDPDAFEQHAIDQARRSFDRWVAEQKRKTPEVDEYTLRRSSKELQDWLDAIDFDYD